WIDSSVGYFRPIPAIPRGPVTSATYATALSSTIAHLQEEAKSDGVTLPPQCSFSFSKQLSAMTFDPGSLTALAGQLGEVKAIVEMLFAARINALDSFQRVRLPDDLNGQQQGPQSDYIDELPVTNDLAVVTPYVVTFRCFTPELARVIAGFATASNTFIIKSVDVQPAVADAAAGVAEMQPGMPGRLDLQQQQALLARRAYFGGNMPPQPVAPAYQPATSKGGLQTVLKEHLLLIRIEVELVKLLPKR
ncbi:MAG TPA: Amuc_1100 family pilus-like protein, partial [Verrucomicrobiae bacterium]